MKTRFDWSDHDGADALGVWPSVVFRYRMTGVPNHQIKRLSALNRALAKDVDPPRRGVPKRARRVCLHPLRLQSRAVVHDRDRLAGTRAQELRLVPVRTS